MEDEQPTCGDCGGVPEVDAEGFYVMDGWVEGEFGECCPNCAAQNAELQHEAGVDAIAEALAATKKEGE